MHVPRLKYKALQQPMTLELSLTFRLNDFEFYPRNIVLYFMGSPRNLYRIKVKYKSAHKN
jgi:hypothetical protein